MGTAHILEAVKRLELPCPVIVSTATNVRKPRVGKFAYRGMIRSRP